MRVTPSDDASAEYLDQQKRYFSCLGCGEVMWTTRCHRLCKKCSRRADADATPPCRANGLKVRGPRHLFHPEGD